MGHLDQVFLIDSLPPISAGDRLGQVAVSADQFVGVGGGIVGHTSE